MPKQSEKAAQRPADPRRRRALLDLLKCDGPQDAATLAARLGVTAMAVRQHLYSLAEEGLVDHEEEARPIGRPAKLWRLTAAADARFPDAHAELTVALIAMVRESFGEAGLAQLLERRRETLAAEYARRLASARSLGARVRALAQLRSEEGYMCRAERAPDGSWLLLENHCPICVAASRCQGLCSIEQAVFQSVVGPGASVQRTEHLLAGARRCAYRIAPVRDSSD